VAAAEARRPNWSGTGWNTRAHLTYGSISMT
jgi:hypothetical protein